MRAELRNQVSELQGAGASNSAIHSHFDHRLFTICLPLYEGDSVKGRSYLTSHT